MLIHIIKFIHVLFALGLLGSTIFCLALINAKQSFTKQHTLILILSVLAAITGTLLVHPKSYTFHTNWIQAAYLLLSVFALSILVLMRVELKKLWLKRLIYLLLVILLIAIAHDAVVKDTFLF